MATVITGGCDMSFFKDFKEDLAQAVNELVQDPDTKEEDDVTASDNADENIVDDTIGDLPEDDSIDLDALDSIMAAAAQADDSEEDNINIADEPDVTAEDYVNIPDDDVLAGIKDIIDSDDTDSNDALEDEPVEVDDVIRAEDYTGISDEAVTLEDNAIVEDAVSDDESLYKDASEVKQEESDFDSIADLGIFNIDNEAEDSNEADIVSEDDSQLDSNNEDNNVAIDTISDILAGLKEDDGYGADDKDEHIPDNSIINNESENTVEEPENIAKESNNTAESLESTAEESDNTAEQVSGESELPQEQFEENIDTNNETQSPENVSESVSLVAEEHLTPVKNTLEETEAEAELSRMLTEDYGKISEEDKRMIENMQEEVGQERTEEAAVFTAGVRIKGDVESTGSVEVIGEIEGNITCLGKLVVSGKVTGDSQAEEVYANKATIEGNIESSGAVKIGAGTVIVGNIKGTSAVIAGAIKGDIDVQGPVVVDTSAVVMGNIKSRSVQINSGAVIEGFCSQCYSDINVKDFFGDKKAE